MNYTTIKVIKAEIEDYHIQNSAKEMFIEALKAIRSRGELEDKIFVNCKLPEKWNDTFFEEYFLETQIYVGDIINNNNSTEIKDKIVIPFGKDIYVFQHLPYVNDGIHEHNYFEINYVYRGECVQYISDKRILKEGEICFIAPHTKHNVMVENDSFVISLLIRQTTFDAIFWNFLTKDDLLATFFRNTLYDNQQENYIMFHTNNNEIIKEIIQNIAREANNDDNYSSVCCNSYLQILFSILLRKYGDTIVYYGEETKTNINGDFAMIIECINRNYRTVTLKNLAEFFHYSESYLSKLIKKNLNKSFVRVLQDIRMRHAEEYLINTTKTIEMISEEVGYESVDHFTRTFKKYHDITPSTYRKKKSKENI